MSRSPTFKCVDCWHESAQALRGGRLRTRCPDCYPKFKKKYQAAYHIKRKAARDAWKSNQEART